MTPDITELPYPPHTPPAPPEGMQWEYRGLGWHKDEMTNFYTEHFETGRVGLMRTDTPMGAHSLHYFEAVPIPTDPICDFLDHLRNHGYANPSPYAPQPEAPAPEEDILEEALRITSGDRQNQYGPPEQDFARTAGMWNSLFGDKLKVPFIASDVAMALICLKLSRETHQKKRDSATDIAGYARCMHLCNLAAEKGGAE